MREVITIVTDDDASDDGGGNGTLILGLAIACGVAAIFAAVGAVLWRKRSRRHID